MPYNGELTRETVLDLRLQAQELFGDDDVSINDITGEAERGYFPFLPILCDLLTRTPAPLDFLNSLSQMTHLADTIREIPLCTVVKCLLKFGKEPIMVLQRQQ